LIDTSPSAESRKEEMVDYAHRVIGSLGPDDQVMIATFNLGWKVAPFTKDKALIEQYVTKWREGDGTSLYDSLTEIFKKHLNAFPGRKSLIILTDGIDTTSRKARYESSLIEIEKSDVLIYPVYWDTMEDYKKMVGSFPAPFFSMAPGYSDREYQRQRIVGALYLDDLANATGGRSISYRNLNNSKIQIDIPEELRHQYILTFTPTVSFTSGQRKQVQVRINYPNLVIRARGSIIRN
jgi:VWFA-related protein